MTRPTAMAPDASTSPVDWSRPIEAVHEDGRVVPVTLGRRDETMDSSIFVNGYRQRVHFDGKEDWAADWGGLHLIRAWRIRNVQPTTPERDPALWDRMEALVRRIGERSEQFFVYNGDAKTLNGWIVEARAIVADLPKPVDPDLIEARDLLSHSFVAQDDEAEKLVLRAIKRGRELAAPEVSHVG